MAGSMRFLQFQATGTLDRSATVLGLMRAYKTCKSRLNLEPAACFSLHQTNVGDLSAAKQRLLNSINAPRRFTLSLEVQSANK